MSRPEKIRKVLFAFLISFCLITSVSLVKAVAGNVNNTAHCDWFTDNGSNYSVSPNSSWGTAFVGRPNYSYRPYGIQQVFGSAGEASWGPAYLDHIQVRFANGAVQTRLYPFGVRQAAADFTLSDGRIVSGRVCFQS